MPLSPNDDVVETITTERADHSLSECVGLRSAWLGHQDTRAQATDSACKVAAVNRVPVVDENTRRHVGVSDGFDQALGGPGTGWMFGDAHVDDATAAESGPGRPVLRDGPGIHAVPGLRQFGGDAILTPRKVVAPHSADEGAPVGVDGRAAGRAARTRSPAPEQSPAGPVSGDDGFRLDDDDRLAKRPESAGEGGDQPPVAAAESWPCDTTSENDELLAEHEVLGQECRARREDGQDDGSQAVEDRGHGPVVPRRPGQGTAVSSGRVRRAGGFIRRSLSGRHVYARRKVIPEPVFGQIKEARGVRRFLLQREGPFRVERKAPRRHRGTSPNAFVLTVECFDQARNRH